MRTIRILPVILLLICSSCKTDYEKAESVLVEKYSQPVTYSDLEIQPLNAIQAFENELLRRQLIDSVSKESYLRLMHLVILDSIRINTREIADQNEEIQILGTPMMTASLLKAFQDVKDKYNLTDKNHSIVRIADVTHEIEITGDFGDLKLNNELIHQINDEDFKKPIYRAPFLEIIYDIAQRNNGRKKVNDR